MNLARGRRSLLLASLALAPLSLAPAQDDANVLDHTVGFEEYGITLELPEELFELKEGNGRNSECKGHWLGRLDDAQLSIKFWAIPFSKAEIGEPDDATSLWVENFQDPRGFGRTEPMQVTEGKLVEGKLGVTGYASLVQGVRNKKGETGPIASLFFLGMVLPGHGAIVEVECRPVATPEHAAVILDFLEGGVLYEGEVRDPLWPDQEAEARWNEHAPESARGDKFEKPIRTEHYIILTNSFGGEKFAKKMEECYKKIQKTFPFQEVKGRKLMPVFLFRDGAQYHDFCVSVAGWSLAQAKQSKGHAWRDYYATWYEAPNDPVHIHEATHQIFANRLGLSGGGSWFQEGVAEYMSTSKNDRNVAAQTVEKGNAPSLRNLMGRESLLFSSGDDDKGGNPAGDAYKQAALIVEFLREGKFGKDGFQDYLQAVGRVSRSDLDAIEAALRGVYGVGIDGLEEELVKYCKRR